MTTRRMTAVAPVPGRRALNVLWETGEQTQVELADYIDTYKAMKPLRDLNVFQNAALGDWGLEVTFGDDDLAIPASLLWRLQREQAAKAMSNDAFKDWMLRNRLSLTLAAEALSLARRTVTGYSSGKMPIPPHVALACIGWEYLSTLDEVGSKKNPANDPTFSGQKRA